VLLGYHYYCGRLLKQLHTGKFTWSGQQLRVLNEAPTVLLLIIVLLAVFKNSLPLDITTAGILGAIVAMAAAIQLYAKKRRQDKERLSIETLGEKVA